MASGKKIRFIYNPRSGMIHPKGIILRLIDYYFPPNLCEHDFWVTEYKGHAIELSRDAVEKNYDIVVAIGGDGTVNEVATGLVNTDTVLGIVPLGSGNGLARSLSVPMFFRKAIQLVTRGIVHTIDAGKVGDRYFFVTAGFGFDAVVGKRFENTKMRGPAPYYVFSVQEFFRYHAPLFEIKYEGKKVRTRALIVAAANTSQYGNNAIIAPRARPDDGLLDLAVINDVNLATTLFYLPTLFTGKIEKTPVYQIYRSTHFDIYREAPGPYTLDGEVFEGDRHIEVSLLPGALKVIVHENYFEKSTKIEKNENELTNLAEK